jgi:hypothetical protein
VTTDQFSNWPQQALLPLGNHSAHNPPTLAQVDEEHNVSILYNSYVLDNIAEGTGQVELRQLAGTGSRDQYGGQAG